MQASRSPIEVRRVTASNLDREFKAIKDAIFQGKYSHATVDTEFKLAFENKMTIQQARIQSPEQRYREIKARVDGGSIRQLGVTLSADDSSDVLVWEFILGPCHFLEEPNWYDDERINTYFFTELLLSSGLMCNPKITWVMFHGGFDLAYLIKLATFWSPLPDTLSDFMRVLKTYMGDLILDVKYLIKFTDNLYGVLSSKTCIYRSLTKFNAKFVTK